MAVRSLPALAAALVSTGVYAGEPRPQPADYPVHAVLGKAALGAEYLVHTVSGRNQSFLARDYLVVEVGLYPAKGTTLVVSNSHFTLRLNGKKSVLIAQPPAFVAASLKYPDWEYRPSVIAVAGVGDAGVILGRPQRTERFPGDPVPSRERLPDPPKAPSPQDRSGLEKTPVRPEEVAVEEALPEGEISRPVRGYLYFHYKGKTKSIRSVELVYNGPGGAAGTITLRFP